MGTRTGAGSPVIRPTPIKAPSGLPSGPISPALSERRMSRGLSPRTTARAHAEDLSRFVDLCRTAYFDQDQTALALVDATVRNEPLATRSAFIKQQGAIRVEYHRQLELQRQEHLTQALRKTASGGTISAIVGSSTEAMRSSTARKERQRRLMQFLSNHAVRSMIGVHPFLRSLYSALEIQHLPVARGGAGKRLVEWQLDEAVFMEASGADFLRDSIELLKGVLGMDESLKDTRTVSWAAESDSESDLDEPLSPQSMASPEKMLISIEQPELGAADRPSLGLRGRSTSDPFLDPGSDATSPVLPSAALPRPAKPIRRPSATALPPVVRIRTFVFPPYLTNPELEDLAALFPQWMRAGSTPAKALEEGSAGGHGTLRIGQRPRDEGFEGGTLERFVHWLLRIFHLA